MKTPIFCWRCALLGSLLPALWAWLYPPAREGLAELAVFVGLGLTLALGVPWLVNEWSARRILREGRRIRPRGRTVIPASHDHVAGGCCQHHHGPPAASAEFGIVWDAIYHPGGSMIRETWGHQRLELARILYAAGKWHGGAA